MKKKEIIIQGSIRKNLGKSNSRKLRLKNKIPSTVYGKNKTSFSIELKHDSIFHIQKESEFYSQPIKLCINLDKFLVITKEVQWHPFKQKILHIDFLFIK